jgi:hypothetical protein
LDDAIISCASTVGTGNALLFLQETPDHRLDGWHMLMIIMKIKQKTDKLWLVDKKIINVQKRSPPQILFFTGGG